jgi:signal transduction histidine kinase
MAAEGRQWRFGKSWLEVAWGLFALANLWAILVFPSWETVPFHFIWVSLTILYGFRVWAVRPTMWTLGVVMASTAALIAYDFAHGAQPADEITEVPLMAAMFVAMVWHAQRRLAATREIEHVSRTNLQLLERERRFVQDASHELRTPITIALGHIDLLARTAKDPEVREDARVAMEELLRLRALADRLLTLASLDEAEPLRLAPADVDGLIEDALRRWGAVPRTWTQGERFGGIAHVDRERIVLAIDALVDNAVKYTKPGDRIELAASRRNGTVLLAVSDSGRGIAQESVSRIFDRFARADPARSRKVGGVGLGLAIVKAIAEAHGGSLNVVSSLGTGSRFELALPISRPEPVPDDAHAAPHMTG